MRTPTLISLLLAAACSGTTARAEEQPNNIHIGAGFSAEIGAFVEVAYEHRTRDIRTGVISIPLMVLVRPRTAALPAVGKWVMDRRREYRELDTANGDTSDTGVRR